MIGFIGFIEPVGFIGSNGGSVDPFFNVTNAGEPVTHMGAMVTHTIPIPENAVYSGGEPVTNAGDIVTSGA